MPTYRLKDEYRHPEGEPVGYEQLLQDMSQAEILNLLSLRSSFLSDGFAEGTNRFTHMFEVVKDGGR